MHKQHNIRENIKRDTWVRIVFAIYFWAWSQPLNVVDIFSELYWRKLFFSFASRYQLQIAAWLVVGSQDHSLPSQPQESQEDREERW